MEPWVRLTTVRSEAAAIILAERLKKNSIPNWTRPTRIDASPLYPALFPHYIYVLRQDLPRAHQVLRGEKPPPAEKKS